jgi:hypothetical protein
METGSARVSRKATIAGWIVGALPALALIISSTFKFFPPAGIEVALGGLGLRIDQLSWLGPLEAAVAIVYLIPRTAVLGAILVTGYMGGAILTHLRVDDFMIVPHILLGALVWLGIWLRDPRLRDLIPIRS